MPALLVPDNTKVAVIKACLYDRKSIGATSRQSSVAVARASG
jgi:hypothetical protein